MSQAKQGDEVKVNYTGRLNDGTVFDTSDGRDPMAFTLGSGQVIPGFDEAVDGMGIGDSKTITISSADAYGPYREDMVLNVPKEQLPEDLDPQVGQQLQMGQDEENTLIVSIIEVADESITLDANHPLAGKDLTFDIELVGIG